MQTGPRPCLLRRLVMICLNVIHRADFKQLMQAPGLLTDSAPCFRRITCHSRRGTPAEADEVFGDTGIIGFLWLPQLKDSCANGHQAKQDGIEYLHGEAQA